MLLRSVVLASAVISLSGLAAFAGELAEDNSSTAILEAAPVTDQDLMTVRGQGVSFELESIYNLLPEEDQEEIPEEANVVIDIPLPDAIQGGVATPQTPSAGLSGLGSPASLSSLPGLPVPIR